MCTGLCLDDSWGRGRGCFPDLICPVIPHTMCFCLPTTEAGCESNTTPVGPLWCNPVFSSPYTFHKLGCKSVTGGPIYKIFFSSSKRRSARIQRRKPRRAATSGDGGRAARRSRPQIRGRWFVLEIFFSSGKGRAPRFRRGKDRPDPSSGSGASAVLNSQAEQQSVLLLTCSH